MGICEVLCEKLQAGDFTLLELARPDVQKDYRHSECHPNVAKWIALHSDHRAIRGWLVTAQGVFVKHSVVDTGRELLDITPRLTADMMKLRSFIAYDVAFDELPPQVICLCL